jgi:hypothetical protein
MLQRVLTLLALCWAIAVAYFGLQSAPAIPLDVSATDPATIEALNAARVQHGLLYGLLALVPAVMLIALGRWLSRAR